MLKLLKLRLFVVERLGCKLLALEDEMRRTRGAMDVLAPGPKAMGLWAGVYVQR